MSFPPHLNRPPMGIPALPPGIPPPQFPGFPPPVPPGTPMIPVPMSIMAPAPTVLVPTVSMVGKHLGARKDHPGLKAKENDENCGPTTTVFVGNISEKASDMLIRQLLAKCGLVLSWKRVQGASGKLQAFGFCEYKEPESTLRALRLLHDLQIGEKKLLVKVDAKTKAQLDEWKAKKKASNGNARPETVTNDDEEALDEETKRRDQMIKGAIEVLIREYSSELNAPSQESDSHPRKKKKEKKEDIFRRFPVAPLIPYPLITKEDINAIEMEEDKRDLISREISKFRDTHKKTGRRRSMVYVKNILDNATKVISNLEARNLEPRLTPLFQEEDNHQRLLMGLMVSELKDHLLRHLQGVEKKKIEQMALDYVSKLLDLVCQIMETSWRKHSLHPCVPHFSGRASAAEFKVFHIMTRILEATKSLFLPLPPGFHTLHTILGVHCLPLHNLLHYIDSGVLLLTETAVTRLMKDLDNTEKNEKLKFSIIVRLPPLIGQKICRLWDHPMSSNIISRNHVKRLLQNYKKKPPSSVIHKSSFSVEFLPLNYFVEILTDIESSNQALYAFEGHDNVDAKFVEEAALKHTMMLLGL